MQCDVIETTKMCTSLRCRESDIFGARDIFEEIVPHAVWVISGDGLLSGSQTIFLNFEFTDFELRLATLLLIGEHRPLNASTV